MQHVRTLPARIAGIAALCAALCLGACLSTSPLPGLLLTDTAQSFNGTGRGQLGPGRIRKVGRSCNYGVFPLLFYFTFNQASLESAMEDGDITRIAVVDRSTFSILLGFFTKECIVVHGE